MFSQYSETGLLPKSLNHNKVSLITTIGSPNSLHLNITNSTTTLLIPITYNTLTTILIPSSVKIAYIHFPVNCKAKNPILPMPSIPPQSTHDTQTRDIVSDEEVDEPSYFNTYNQIEYL